MLKNDINVWQVFRKEIDLPDRPQCAVARIAVDSKYWLWINGKMVVYEGGLKRGPDPKNTYFDVVDLSRHLKKGKNTIAVLAWYWGKDGFSHKNSGVAGFVADFDIDGKKIGTDDAWKAMRHTAYGNTGAPHPNYRLSDDNIHFDARNDIGPWISSGYDDSKWPNAIVYGKPPVAPWHQLVERPIPLWKVSPLRRYENLKGIPKVSKGESIVAKLPLNITISPYLKIKAPAGLVIDMRTDNYNGGSEFNYRAEYVTKEGVQEFESLAYLNGHEMIYTMPKGVEILELAYRETKYDTEFVGSFQSSDPFLDRLWLKCRNTMNVNMRDAIQDPDRERAQWWGDAAIVQGEILHSCDVKAHALIKKAIDNLVDWQKDDGVLYSPVPAGSWDRELPGQMLASIGRYGFWYYYRYTGDMATIKHAYPAVKRYLDLWKLGPDGLLVHRPGGWDWGDWGDNIDRPVLDNALLYQALGTAVDMAKIVGDQVAISKYQNMMKSIDDNYDRVFWTGTSYRSEGFKGLTDDRGHAWAVISGLAKQQYYPAIKKVFETSFNSSPYMEKYVMESLFKMNYPDAALTRMKQRYQKMVESPLTTLWEGWGVGKEGYGGGSYNHGWSGGPLTLLMEYVCGISPLEPGFVKFQVSPQPGHLVNASASFESVKGTIRSSFERSSEGIQVKVTVPASSNAVVLMPSQAVKRIKINGTLAWENGNYLNGHKKPSEVVESRIGFEVAAGEWKFIAEVDHLNRRE
ncbi:alpha-L-rhamnosidase-related protein [Mucilaginibacter limnophilus]|nr:alpha-L-rhamnosidase C-terminal domain-containing protein [Mucilaginibacter limnophilus]